MANTKSAIKYIRKTETRTAQNRQVKSRLKTLARKLDAARVAGDAEVAEAISRTYISALEKATKRGIVHKNKVARHKSRYATPVVASA